MRMKPSLVRQDKGRVAKVSRALPCCLDCFGHCVVEHRDVLLDNLDSTILFHLSFFEKQFLDLFQGSHCGGRLLNTDSQRAIWNIDVVDGIERLVKLSQVRQDESWPAETSFELRQHESCWEPCIRDQFNEGLDHLAPLHSSMPKRDEACGDDCRNATDRLHPRGSVVSEPYLAGDGEHPEGRGEADCYQGNVAQHRHPVNSPFHLHVDQPPIHGGRIRTPRPVREGF